MALPYPTLPTAGRLSKWLAVLAAGVLTSALTLTAPASARTTTHHPADPAGRTRVSGPMTHPDADHMGSTIRGHERITHPLAVQPASVPQLPGLDVSGWQGDVNWDAVKSNGAQFAYMKATENTNYQSPNFTQQYEGAYYHGIIRGAYHFALPDRTSGAAQADYFAHHGGGWSRDGMTLPGMLDIEYNPYGATCYGLSQGAMVNWIRDFINTLARETGRWAVIYTTTGWWSQCTGNYGGFAGNSPLFIANYNGTPNPLPNGWPFYTFWQFADHGKFPGDQDVFNGAYARLKVLANNG